MTLDYSSGLKRSQVSSFSRQCCVCPFMVTSSLLESHCYSSGIYHRLQNVQL